MRSYTQHSLSCFVLQKSAYYIDLTNEASILVQLIRENDDEVKRYVSVAKQQTADTFEN